MDRKQPGAIKVQSVVSVKVDGAQGKADVRPILYSTALLEHQDQEATLVRFSLTREGDLVRDSVHSIFTKLRIEGPK